MPLKLHLPLPVHLRLSAVSQKPRVQHHLHQFFQWNWTGILGLNGRIVLPPLLGGAWNSATSCVTQLETSAHTTWPVLLETGNSHSVWQPNVRTYWCHALCPGYGVEVKSCSLPILPSWGFWTSWSECSMSCGIGTMYRSRICSAAECSGEDSEVKYCSFSTCSGRYSVSTLSVILVSNQNRWNRVREIS
jgi:hypothetical protein